MLVTAPGSCRASDTPLAEGARRAVALQAWPDVPTRYLLCRDDRMFPAAWARRHARERLGIEADEIDGGHYITLSRPLEQRCQHIGVPSWALHR